MNIVDWRRLYEAVVTVLLVLGTVFAICCAMVLVGFVTCLIACKLGPIAGLIFAGAGLFVMFVRAVYKDMGD